jgi:hypothetical protein
MKDQVTELYTTKYNDSNQALEEGFIAGTVLIIDSTHLEAFDRNPRLDEGKSSSKPAPDTGDPVLLDASAVKPLEKVKSEKPRRHKRGRIPKAEKAASEARLATYKASPSLFEREVADILPATYQELRYNYLTQKEQRTLLFIPPNLCTIKRKTG